MDSSPEPTESKETSTPRTPSSNQILSAPEPVKPTKSLLLRKQSRDDFEVSRTVVREGTEVTLKKTISRDDLDIPSLTRASTVSMTSFARTRSTIQLGGGISRREITNTPTFNGTGTLGKKKKSTVLSGGSIRKRFTGSVRKRADFPETGDGPREEKQVENKISFIFPDRIETFADFMPNIKLQLVLRELSISSEKFSSYSKTGEAVPSDTLLGQCPSQIFFLPPKPEVYSEVKRGSTFSDILAATEILARSPRGYFSRSEALRDRSNDEMFLTNAELVLNSEDIKNRQCANWKQILSKKKSKAAGSQKKEKEERKTVLDAHTKTYKETEIKFSKQNRATCIQAATLDSLIEVLTHPMGRDKQVELDFIMSFDIILSARELFDKIAQRYSAGNVKVKENVIDFLKTLLTRRQHLFLDEPEFQADFLTWTEGMDSEGVDAVKIRGFQLFAQSQLAGHRTAYQEDIESKLHDEDLADGPPPYPLFDSSSTTIDLLDIHPIELARQMTILQYKLLKEIRPHEWLNQGWTKGKSPNIMACIENFNDLSNWVATCICLGQTLEIRSTIIRFLVITATECAVLNNFHAILSIISGFTSAPVTRLLQTWDSIDSVTAKRFDQLKELTSQDQNYKKMRKIIEVKPDLMEPCIPYIGLYLHDLIFIEDGNPDRTAEGLINFEKHTMLSKHVLTLWDLSKNRYKLIPNAQILEYLQDLKVIAEDELYEESLLRESRADNAPLRAKMEKRGLL